MDAYNRTNESYSGQSNTVTNESTYGTPQPQTPYIEDQVANFNRESGETAGRVVDKLTGKGGLLNSPLAKAAAIGLLAFAASRINNRRR